MIIPAAYSTHDTPGPSSVFVRASQTIPKPLGPSPVQIHAAPQATAPATPGAVSPNVNSLALVPPRVPLRLAYVPPPACAPSEHGRSERGQIFFTMPQDPNHVYRIRHPWRLFGHVERQMADGLQKAGMHIVEAGQSPCNWIALSDVRDSFALLGTIAYQPTGLMPSPPPPPSDGLEAASQALMNVSYAPELAAILGASALGVLLVVAMTPASHFIKKTGPKIAQGFVAVGEKALAGAQRLGLKVGRRRGDLAQA